MISPSPIYPTPFVLCFTIFHSTTKQKKPKQNKTKQKALNSSLVVKFGLLWSVDLFMLDKSPLIFFQKPFSRIMTTLTLHLHCACHVSFYKFLLKYLDCTTLLMLPQSRGYWPMLFLFGKLHISIRYSTQ